MSVRPKALSTDQVSDALRAIEGWDGDAVAIARTVEARDFPSAIALVNQVASLAEDMDHHPDIDIRWRKVTFTLTTHDAGGVTVLDIDLAGKINQLYTPSR